MCVLYYFVSWIGNIIELEQCHDHWIGSFVSHSDSNVNEYSGELNVSQTEIESAMHLCYRRGAVVYNVTPGP